MLADAVTSAKCCDREEILKRREEMLARGQQEIEAVEGLAEARAARRGDAGDGADENEAPAGAGDGANEQGADAVAPVKAPEKA